MGARAGAGWGGLVGGLGLHVLRRQVAIHFMYRGAACASDLIHAPAYSLCLSPHDLVKIEAQPVVVAALQQRRQE